MRFPDSAQPWTLQLCLEGEWSEDEKTAETARVFSEAAGGCKIQKQRRTSRLGKHAWMPLKKPVLCLPACLIPVTLSQPCLSGHYCWIYFCYLFSFLRTNLTNIRTWSDGKGGFSDPERSTCPINTCCRKSRQVLYTSPVKVLWQTCGMDFTFFSCNITP